MQVVVNLKEIEKKAKKELSKETFSKFACKLLHVFNSGKKFRCYSSYLSTKDHLFDEATIKKMRQDPKHSLEKRQQYSKNTYGPNKSYKGHHYKGKTYENQPSQQQLSYYKRNNNQGHKQRN